MISSEHAYWLTWFEVRRVPLAGGPDEVFANVSGAAYTAIDSSFLYLGVNELSTRSLRRVSLVTQAEDELASDLPWLHHLAINGQDALWVTGFEMFTIPITGGTPSLFYTYAGPTALDDTHAFVSDPGGMYALPLTGGSPTLLTTGGAWAMALDATHVYFTLWAPQPSAGQVVKVPRAGGSPVVLATNQYQPTAIVVDDANVYFARDDSFIMRVPKGGGTAEVVAAGAGYGAPQSLAIDDTHLYWASNRNAPCGSIWKVAK